MRKRCVRVAVAFLVLGMAGVADAAVLNWEGTATILWDGFLPCTFTGGGVATVNGSSGAVPAHLGTLRFAASRGQIQGTGAVFLTDPNYPGSALVALKYEIDAAGSGSCVGHGGQSLRGSSRVSSLRG